jgi:hypothetical protein
MLGVSKNCSPSSQIKANRFVRTLTSNNLNQRWDQRILLLLPLLLLLAPERVEREAVERLTARRLNLNPPELAFNSQLAESAAS